METRSAEPRCCSNSSIPDPRARNCACCLSPFQLVFCNLLPKAELYLEDSVQSNALALMTEYFRQNNIVLKNDNICFRTSTYSVKIFSLTLNFKLLRFRIKQSPDLCFSKAQVECLIYILYQEIMKCW